MFDSKGLRFNENGPEFEERDSATKILCDGKEIKLQNSIIARTEILRIAHRTAEWRVILVQRIRDLVIRWNSIRVSPGDIFYTLPPRQTNLKD